ncbi:3-phosphoshikimate 1-carboxyvinyltransferase [Paraburkholderia sp. Se-20369]|nr:3-phosphoshikimate 1-carboxyvinyltransferase [Paraburkholderia sp. Se-20369]
MSKATVYPSHALDGSVTLPASKPHVQRALLLALLNSGTTRLENVSWCTETERQLAALQQFGLRVVERSDTALTLRGVGRDVETPELVEAAGSGMLFRMCTALASLTDGPVRIRCNDSLFARDSLFDDGFFSHLGVTAQRARDNLVTITKRRHAERIPLSTEKSTQFISFALFVAPFAANPTLRVRDDSPQEGYIDMSIKAMARLSSIVERTADGFSVGPYLAGDIAIAIPTDFTSISYIASAILSLPGRSCVTIGDYRSGGTLNEATLFGTYEALGVRLVGDDARHTLTIKRVLDTPPCPDELSLHELPSAAANIIAAASNLGAPLRFGGVDGINNHKCQRAFVINENIRAMGGRSSLLFSDLGKFDKIEIAGGGRPLQGGIELRSYRDHRICAANIIASLGAQRKSVVHDTDKLDDGFPRFIETLRALGAELA